MLPSPGRSGGPPTRWRAGRAFDRQGGKFSSPRLVLRLLRGLLLGQIAGDAGHLVGGGVAVAVAGEAFEDRGQPAELVAGYLAVSVLVHALDPRGALGDLGRLLALLARGRLGLVRGGTRADLLASEGPVLVGVEAGEQGF